jgi:hypothetical protein
MVALKGKRNGEDWHLAASLKDLLDEVNERWPGRPTASDGSIGDAAHAARKSEHNPDSGGVVRALDLTRVSAAMANAVIAAVKVDERAWYVIHDGYIYSRTNGWEKRKYDGANPHRSHLHVSVRAGLAGAAPGPWGLLDKAPAKTAGTKPAAAPKLPPTISRGPGTQPNTRALQRFLGVTEAVFGDRTVAAVRRYQKMHDLKVDGIVGPKTWAVVLTALKLPGYHA